MMGKANLEDYDDRALDAAITAWGTACEASRQREHIDVADRIRNALIGERIRRQGGPTDSRLSVGRVKRT